MADMQLTVGYGKDQAVNRHTLALHTACQGKKPVTDTSYTGF